MASEMIERAAKALYESHGSDSVARTGDAFPVPSWDNAHQSVKDDCRVIARDVVKVMREPTKEILKAIGDAIDNLEDGGMMQSARESYAEVIWNDGIDAALKE